MLVSGLNQTVVPVPFAFPMTSSFLVVSPRSNAMWWRLPSRSTHTSSFSDSAFTTETPPPCRHRPDVHRRAAADRLEPFQDLNRIGLVVAVPLVLGLRCGCAGGFRLSHRSLA